MSVSVQVYGAVAIVRVDNPPVNALSHSVRKGLAVAIDTTENNSDVKAVLLVCDGRTFIAGADVREFGQQPLEPHLPDIIHKLENTTKPWVAAIHGTALGGGLEVALGCHYRIADIKAKMGLPEVSLGLIPGAGGTVRLPRLVVAEKALEMIAGGKPINAADAFANGLVDALADEQLEDVATTFANKIKDNPLPIAISKREPVGPNNAEAFETQKAVIVKRAKGQLAPVAALKAVETALEKPSDVALNAERDTFIELKSGEQSNALRYAFFAERSAAKLDAVKGVAPLKLEKIGVIGGGTMGAGIASACLLSGLSVNLIEQSEDAATSGAARVSEILDGSQKRGLINAEKASIIRSRFAATFSYDDLSDVDLVIEAVFEDMDVKKSVFAKLEQVARPDAILASNTSYLDVNEIANSLANPSRVIGLHFFSPAHVMKLLELVVTNDATPEALSTGMALGKMLRKVTVPAGVCDGFIANRILTAYRRECDYLIEDGALPEEVDAAMTSFGFPMGIFAMQDLAGLDIGWAARKRRAPNRPADERYVEIADKICEMGRFGRKTRAGWYDYSQDKNGLPDPLVLDIIEKESTRKGISRKPFSQDEIIERILVTMQNEGAKVLAEGIAQSPEAVDTVMINGYGFPRWKGGPMFMLKSKDQ